MSAFLTDELRRAIQGTPKPLIVCGAGVTIDATHGAAPNWQTLIERGIRRIADLDLNASGWASSALDGLGTASSDDWISIADEITARLGGNHNAEFRTWLYDNLGSLKAAREDLLEAIVALECPIATTNYDSLISDFSARPPILWNDYSQALQFLAGTLPGVLHLHGHWHA